MVLLCMGCQSNNGTTTKGSIIEVSGPTTVTITWNCPVANSSDNTVARKVTMQFLNAAGEVLFTDTLTSKMAPHTTGRVSSSITVEQYLAASVKKMVPIVE